MPPAPVRVTSQRSLVPNVASGRSVANDKGFNEMIPGLCTDLLAFALQLRKTSARRPSDEGAVHNFLNLNLFNLRNKLLRAKGGS